MPLNSLGLVDVGHIVHPEKAEATGGRGGRIQLWKEIVLHTHPEKVAATDRAVGAATTVPSGPCRT